MDDDIYVFEMFLQIMQLFEDNIPDSRMRVLSKNPRSNDQFWNESARSLFVGLALFDIVYQQNSEFIYVVQSIMKTDLRTHIETALNTVPTSSVVASYLCSMANTADETLFSCNITMCQYLYFFVSQEAIFTLRDNVHRANPRLLNSDGTRL